MFLTVDQAFEKVNQLVGTVYPDTLTKLEEISNNSKNKFKEGIMMSKFNFYGNILKTIKQ